MIAKGLISKRANEERLPAHTIERDYVLAHLCADIGAIGDPRLVFKGGTLLRLCLLPDYRYSADLDFSAVDGLSAVEAVDIVGAAVERCRTRVELPMVEISELDSGTGWISFVGPLGGKPRGLKLDISDDELVETHRRTGIQPLWPDMPEDSAVEGYGFDDVGAEKLRCIAERLQCRDLFDLHALLDGRYVEPMECWELYLRKAANDEARSRQRTPTHDWAATFERRMAAYRGRWDGELGDYLSDVPRFADVERRSRRYLDPIIEAAEALARRR